jgi:hypothetical protein
MFSECWMFTEWRQQQVYDHWHEGCGKGSLARVHWMFPECSLKVPEGMPCVWWSNASQMKCAQETLKS